MNLLIKAKTKTDNSTISELLIDGENECLILEDADRGLTDEMLDTDILKLKTFGKTAIPAGRYQVVITYSSRFKKYLPLLLNVPGFSGIRIHPGNSPADTEGCLLPGNYAAADFVTQSRSAFNKLFAKLQAAERREKIYINIER